MSQSAVFIRQLENLKEGERSRLRRLAGQPLDQSPQGFDLFTGLWWPLRRQSPVAPRRETSWLIAKLYGAFPIPDFRPDPLSERRTLAQLLGACEPPHPACPQAALLSSAPPDRDPARGQFIAARRYRRRFDAILETPLHSLEPHLHWALSVVLDAVSRGASPGLDWVQLLDDLSIWDRGEEHQRKRDISDIWAEQYLNATIVRSTSHAD